jgi:hypothetical protein
MGAPPKWWLFTFLAWLFGGLWCYTAEQSYLGFTHATQLHSLMGASPDIASGFSIFNFLKSNLFWNYSVLGATQIGELVQAVGIIFTLVVIIPLLASLIGLAKPFGGS